MEALYKKLYDKHTELKTKKETEIEHVNQEQEVKFSTYVSDSDELTEHLRKENARLLQQVADLRSENGRLLEQFADLISEVASIRSTKDEENIDTSNASAKQAECCRRNIDSSGGNVNDTSPACCLFQALVEFLVGMKVSAVPRPGGKCISALHQPSGYSFSLTWVNKAAGEETELLYQAQSLGTLERVAPEWMREELMFSTSMCPVFFERVSRAIKLHP